MNEKGLFWRSLNIFCIASVAFISFFIVQEKLSEPKWILNKAIEAGWTGIGNLPTIWIETPDKTVPHKITEQDLYKLKRRVSLLENALLPITVFGGVIGYLVARVIRKSTKHLTTVEQPNS